MNRRDFLTTTAGAAAATATLQGCSSPDEVEIIRPDGVPVGPFGVDSTAEEVTAGIDLSGMTALVTGCNSGLGYESMRVLSLRGATVIGAARTLEKAETACETIPGNTYPVSCELSDLDSINQCAAAAREIGRPIDILMLNAGIMRLPELQQVNGIERQFFVNHIGHFALARQVMDLVEQAPAGRVVVLSSSGHISAPEAGIEFDNLSGARDYDPWKMYGQSKLANGLFAFELARRLEGTNATANAIHPGIINTNLGRHFPAWQRIAASLIGWTFMKNVEEGAATQCYVATAPQIAGVGGYYFSDCNPQLPDPRMNDQALAEQLWAVSEEIVEGRYQA